MTASKSTSADDSAVWWRLPIVWLVIGGPALVVMASVATLAIAVLNPDPVLRADLVTAADQPAVQARNHAASPREPIPASASWPKR